MEFWEGLGSFSLGRSGSDRSPHTGPDSDSFPWVRSWESFLSGPRVAGSPVQGKGGDFAGCKIQLSSGWACLSVSVVSGGRTAARSQHATRGLRSTEKAPIIPSENGPCGWLHGLRSHSLPFTTALPRASKVSFSFLCSHSLFFLSPPPQPPNPLLLSSSQKRASTMPLEGWSGFFSTPVDSAHVDNIHRMSVNQSINQRHLMKEQLVTAQLYNRLSSLSTPAIPPVQQCSVPKSLLLVRLRRNNQKSWSCISMTKQNDFFFFFFF